MSHLLPVLNDTFPRLAVVLEDDPPTAELYAMLLDRMGIRTQIFQDNDPCHRYLLNHHADLFICDVCADPERNGLDFLDLLAHECAAQVPPTIVATALSPAAIRNHPVLKLHHNLRTLYKPFDVDTMTATIAQLL